MVLIGGRRNAGSWAKIVMLCCASGFDTLQHVTAHTGYVCYWVR